MDIKVRLGIIGYGNMGVGHTSNIMDGKCPEIELTAIADIKESRRDAVKEKYGDAIALFDDAEKMMDSGLSYAVLVAVPHYDHPKYSIAAMERGILVMCEKAEGVYAKAVREMNEVADKHPEVVFGMMFNQRTNHVYRKMRELVQSGKYGEIRRTNWLITNWYRTQFYYDSGDWRATWSGEGGGVLLNQCPHQLDLWQWICGMPVKVQSNMRIGQWHDIEVEDDVTTYVEYANGATGVFITTTGDAYGTNRFEVQMDGAKLVVDNDVLTVHEFEQSTDDLTKTSDKSFTYMPVKKLEIETDGLNLQHVGVLNAWAGAILRGEPLVADGREGINGVTLSNAMHLSYFLGKMVDLPVDEDLYYEELMKRVATSRRKSNVTEAVADTSGSYAGTK